MGRIGLVHIKGYNRNAKTAVAESFPKNANPLAWVGRDSLAQNKHVES